MISKMKSLLDETTILNFKFIIKLAKRYKWIIFVAPLLVAVFSAYLFKVQNQIFAAEISFRYIPENKNTGVSALSALVEDDNSRVSPSEITGIAESINFLQGVSQDLADYPNSKDLNLNSIHSVNKKTFDEIIGPCQEDRDCVVNKIRDSVIGLFTLTEDLFVDEKYNVVVKTLEPKTTKILLDFVQKNILSYRLNTIKNQLKSQIQITGRLVAQEEASVDALGLKEVVQERSILADSLEALIKKRELYEVTLGEKKVELEQAQISLKYTKNTLGKKITLNDKKKYEKLKSLLLRKELLSADITALEYSMGSNSNDDNAIIKDLKVELSRINTELKKLESSKSKGMLGDFQDEKLKTKSTVEFSIKVLKDQIDGLAKSIDKINEDRSDIIKKIGNKDSFLSKNQATMDYLKLLQAKFLQLKLIEDTIVADLIFEDYSNVRKRYKKYTLFSVIPFSIAIAFVLSLILLIIRYAFDDRLFDEEEFKSLFSDIEFIGEIPKID